MAIGTTAAILAGAGLAGGGNFLGGLLGRGKAKQIGTVEQQAAEAEAARALARAGEINPYIQEAYQRAQHGIGGVANTNADVIQNRAELAGANALAAGREANAYLDPYRQAGGGALSTLSQLAQSGPVGVGDLTMDPGYQFRLREGMDALEKSAAARGGLLGGGTLKALTKYSQDAASQEYANAWDRAFRGRQQQVNTLSGLANLGYGASGAAGQNLIGTTQYGGTLGTNAAMNAGAMRTNAAQLEGQYGIQSALAQSGNLLNADEIARGQRGLATQARAGSMAAGSNAFNQGLTGAFNAFGQGLTLYGLTRPGAGGNYGVRVPDWVYGVGTMPWGGR